MKTVASHTALLRLALALTAALFVVGGQPGAGEGFPGARHWIAHVATYALIAGAYAGGLPKWPAPAVGLLVAALGGLHEALEIVSHGHAFEYDDFAVNGLAAFAGSVAARWWSSRALRGAQRRERGE